MAEQNADTLLAQTLLALAMDLMASEGPVPTSRLARLHFPGISRDAARKKLARAREMLRSCGLIVEQSVSRRSSTWAVDPACYLENALDPNDISIVCLLASPLLRDESFPHRNNLRFALLKLGDSPTSDVATPPVLDDHTLETVRACLSARRFLEIDYEDAQGRPSHRRVAPLGLFEFRDHSYLVCNTSPELDPDGIRTLRCDRMSHARKRNESFTPPHGFDLNEYRLLPFQMGRTIACATFELPESTLALLLETTLGKGELYREDNRLFWNVDISNFDDAAAWAIAHGLHPAQPAELVSAWRGLLRGCLA